MLRVTKVDAWGKTARFFYDPRETFSHSWGGQILDSLGKWVNDVGIKLITL